MTWYIITAVVAFICGGSAIAYPCMGILQLNGWELGRLNRIRQAVDGNLATWLKKEDVLAIIDKERKL